MALSARGRSIPPGVVRALRSAAPSACEVHDKPDVELFGGGAVRVAIYFDGSYFVVGDYLDAWNDRMNGRPSCCYSLGRGDVRALREATGS